MKTKQTIVLLALLISSVAISQVGIGTVTLDDSAMLTLESTTQGFYPPRMTDLQRNDIANPSPGLVIYNTTENCLQWYNSTVWYSLCSGFISPEAILGEAFTNGFEDNIFCQPELISLTPCSLVNGTSLNDDNTTAEGVEYDWIGATDFVSGGTTRALVDIGGQCWYRRNAINVPTAGTGFDGFYGNETTTEPAPGEGRLYSWGRAMNGATGEDADRSQGICPTGWHVPSDCEWAYLEHSLGMTVEDQQFFGTNFRDTGDVGIKISTLTNDLAGTNVTGFTALFAGLFNANDGDEGAFGGIGTSGYFWSSTERNENTAAGRTLFRMQTGVRRSATPKDFGLSIRCLKD